jgi:PAS domain S-box-containing protein
MEHEEILQAYWSLSPEPALVLDASAHVLAANPAFEALWFSGMPPVSLAGRPLASLLWAEDMPRVRRELDAACDAPRSTLARLVPARGEPVTVELLAGVPQALPGTAGTRRVVRVRALRGDDAAAQLARRIFDAFDNGVLWYDTTMRIVDANLAARRLLALQQDDLGHVRADDLGWQPCDEAGEPLPLERRPVWLVLNGRQPVVTMTLALQLPSGVRRWLRVTAQAVESIGPGRGAGAVVSFTDISEQRQALRSQRESEMLLRLFGDNASDVLWIVDPRSRQLLYVNAAWERIWGLPTAILFEDIEHWLDGIHPDDLRRVVDASRAPTARGTYEVEYRLQPKGLPMRWIRGRGFPIHDGDGRVRYLAGFAEDITLARETAAIREAHRDAQLRLERIVATAPGAVVSYRWREDGTVDMLYASPAVESVTGFPAALVVAGTPPMHALVHADDRGRITSALGRAAAGMTPFRDTFRMLRGGREDDVRWIDAHSMPIDEGGEVTWHGFLIDVTGLREAEEEVRQLNADLERRVAERTAELENKHREMESFTYSVSHDLKAPLRGIDGYSKLLETDHLESLGEEGRFFVSMIRRATNQMGQLIDDLLAYSRVERGRPSLVTLDPAPLVRSLVQEREPEFVSTGGTITVSLAGGDVVGEREGLLLVLRNLVDNAIKFTAGRPGRRIAITSERAGGRVRLSVADNGPGFDMRYHDRIFEIFQRLHRAEDFPGTGVGLAIVRKACERMQGRAWAESVKGEGATFHVELAAGVPAPAPAPAPVDRGPAPVESPPASGMLDRT